MATFAPAQLARGAARLPKSYGLFSVLNFETPTEPHWQAGGVMWDYLDSTGIESVGHPTDADSGRPSMGTPKTFENSLETATALPFSVYGHHKISAPIQSQADAEAWATEHLRAFEEDQVERNLWYGTANNTPNLNTDLVALGTEEAKVALGVLEDWLATAYGSKGVIYMARSVALGLIGPGFLEAKGSLLQTMLGTPVVTSGSFPTTHIRATPALLGMRSEVFHSSQPGSPLLDVKNNDLYAIAERTYLIGFDPTGVGSVTLS